MCCHKTYCNLERSISETSKLVELSSTDTAEIMGLNGDTQGCLMASTLQLKMLAMLLWEWAIVNLLQMNKKHCFQFSSSDNTTVLHKEKETNRLKKQTNKHKECIWYVLKRI